MVQELFHSTWVHSRFSELRVAQSFVFCIVFCESLYCLSFDLLFLITPLIATKVFVIRAYLSISCVWYFVSIPIYKAKNIARTTTNNKQIKTYKAKINFPLRMNKTRWSWTQIVINLVTEIVFNTRFDAVLLRDSK
jgi:hypothetical protein